ncbi:MAG TPA: hypothetical protein VHN77_15235 [Phycisphaerales bacterium]|nr:hypothetical protein [Phycisphaerales bacterium]
MTRPHRTAAVCLAACAMLAACVTERERIAPRGVPVRESGAGKRPAPTPATVPPRPTGPVAQPVREGTTSARVQITVAPLGMLRYDAQTLPLVSPDGAFLAVQEGDAPTWDTLLATDQQEAAETTGIAVYSVGDGLTRTQPVIALPVGCTLGRDANATGYLIESVQPDASRWIGLARWTTGEVEWLAQGTAIAAHAALLATDAHGTHTPLVYSRRDRGGVGHSAIVLRDSLGNESVFATPEVSYCFPTPAPDGSVVFACALRANTLDLIAVRVIDDAQTPHAKKLGAIAATRPLGTFEDPLAIAHQVFAGVQPSAWCDGDAAFAKGAIAFAHPGRGRTAVLNPAEGTLTWMPEKTVSAAAWQSEADTGFFCTAPKELLFQPLTGAASTRILPSPYVARVVNPGTPQMLLFGPSKARQDELELLRLIP